MSVEKKLFKNQETNKKAFKITCNIKAYEYNCWIWIIQLFKWWTYYDFHFFCAPPKFSHGPLV